MFARHLPTLALGVLLLAAPLGCACSGQGNSKQNGSGQAGSGQNSPAHDPGAPPPAAQNTPAPDTTAPSATPPAGTGVAAGEPNNAAPPIHSAMSATTVKGTVTYLERIALKDPEVTVTLVDLGAPAGAKPLGTQTLSPQQGPPYPFVVSYVLGDIQREHLYGVTAEVKMGGKVVFRAAEPVRVLTQGAGTEVEIVVKRVAG